MTDLDVIRKWSVSWYWKADPTHMLSQGFRERARREFLADPVSCLLENVEESQGALRAATRRFHEAKADGLFDRERFRAVDPELKARWMACLDTVQGDYQRARSDVDHWTTQVRLARDGVLRFKKVPPSLRGLADEKSIPSPEEDAETNRQKLEAAEKLARWSAEQRVPGEDDE